MKRNVQLTVVASAVLALGTLSARAGIAGSAHDFSGETWNSSGEICIVCHTPHNANTSVSNSPLWNHDVTTATYTLYTGSGTLDATLGQPSGVSKLCLSCHDGTVALDSFGGNTGSTTIAGDAKLGTDLSNDHPVSFTYDANLASTDGGLFDPSTTNSGLGGTIADDMLFNGQLECASCHDVHNDAGNSHLLVKDNSGSALCLTCHDK
ncbi:MAG: cytochrome C [Verrucomicrobia bacterium]|nr:MAG: cytochrome C [Verrucomicrobiota bacterium]